MKLTFGIRTVYQTKLSPSNATMLQTPTPPFSKRHAAAAAAAATNASAITMSPGGTPVAANGLKLIGMTIRNVVASNCMGSGAAHKAAHANTHKGLGHFSQLNPIVAAQKAANTNTQKGLGCFSQLNPLIKLRLWPACSTCRA
jgi:hypothetical protein